MNTEWTLKGQYCPQAFGREKNILLLAWLGKVQTSKSTGWACLQLWASHFLFHAQVPAPLPITPNWTVTESYRYWCRYISWIWRFHTVSTAKTRVHIFTQQLQFHLQQLSYHYSSSCLPPIRVNYHCQRQPTQVWRSWQSSLNWVSRPIIPFQLPKECDRKHWLPT